MRLENTYSIGDVSRMTGVTKRKLRGWEVAGYITPMRLSYGERAYRRYTDEDVRFIEVVRDMIEEGYRLQAAVEKAKTQLQYNNEA